MPIIVPILPSYGWLRKSTSKPEGSQTNLNYVGLLVRLKILFLSNISELLSVFSLRSLSRRLIQVESQAKITFSYKSEVLGSRSQSLDVLK